MIVRDVVLSSEPRSLRPVARAAADAADRQQRTTREAARSVPLEDSSPGPTPPARPSPPKPQQLTAETAASWLATQPVENRNALAQSLAPELETLREQNRTQGLELGRAQAVQEITRRVESSLVALTGVTTAAEAAFEREAAQLADSCAEIVAEAFLKIAGDCLATREAVVGVVVAVIQRLKDSREVTVRVSSQDLPVLRDYEPYIQQALGSREASLVADPRVSVGGCLVESSLGTLDGRLEVQLRELFETIRAVKATHGAGA